MLYLFFLPCQLSFFLTPIFDVGWLSGPVRSGSRQHNADQSHGEDISTGGKTNKQLRSYTTATKCEGDANERFPQKRLQSVLLFVETHIFSFLISSPFDTWLRLRALLLLFPRSWLRALTSAPQQISPTLLTLCSRVCWWPSPIIKHLIYRLTKINREILSFHIHHTVYGYTVWESFPFGPEIGAVEIFHIESGWREEREKVSLWDKVSYVRLVQPFSRDFILLIIQLRYMWEFVWRVKEFTRVMLRLLETEKRVRFDASRAHVWAIQPNWKKKVTMTISNLYSYEEEIDILMKTTTNLKCEISPHHRIAWIHLNKDETLSSKFFDSTSSVLGRQRALLISIPKNCVVQSRRGETYSLHKMCSRVAAAMARHRTLIKLLLLPASTTAMRNYDTENKTEFWWRWEKCVFSKDSKISFSETFGLV